MMKTMYMLIIGILAMSFNAQGNTKLYIPTDPNQVIEKWAVYPNDMRLKDRIPELLNQAKYPGNSHFYSQAAILIDTNKDALAQNKQYLYYVAVTQQYYHQFEYSAELLESLLTNDPHHLNARLLLANVYSALGKFELARSMCKYLIGKVQSTLVAACVFNIDAQTDDNEQIKSSLSSLATFAKSNQIIDRETELYVDEIRANMAYHINDYSLAQGILRQYESEKAPVSFWVLWADIQLALQQHEVVLNTLGELVSNTVNEDDALLLRLAIAEKRANAENLKWSKKIEERIELRELRQDREHAFDIALYYLELKEDLSTAHKWAKINWQQAKYREDADLLARIERKMQLLGTDAQSKKRKVETL